MSGWRAGIAATLLVVALWQAVVWATGVPRFILPPPMLVAETIWINRALLAEHAFITMSEVLIGLVLGAGLGLSRRSSLSHRQAHGPWSGRSLVFSQSVPVFALAPILTLWLGFGLWSRCDGDDHHFLPGHILFFRRADAHQQRLVGHGTRDGGKPRTDYVQVRIPAALPGFASGLRLAAVYAPIGAIIGEWVGASRGLGYLMLLANGRAKNPI